MDGLLTDGLCTGAVICDLLLQLVLKASEGDVSLQLQRYCLTHTNAPHGTDCNCLCNAMLQDKCRVSLKMNVCIEHTDSIIAFWYTRNTLIPNESLRLPCSSFGGVHKLDLSKVCVYLYE